MFENLVLPMLVTDSASCVPSPHEKITQIRVRGHIYIIDWKYGKMISVEVYLGSCFAKILNYTVELPVKITFYVREKDLPNQTLYI